MPKDSETIKWHHEATPFLTDEEVHVMHRDLSCFNLRPTTCTCYNLCQYKFPQKKNDVSGILLNGVVITL